MAICSLSLSSQAQHFKTGFGPGFIIENAPDIGSRLDLTFTYSTTFFFAEKQRSSLSVGLPITGGTHVDSKNSSNTGYVLDIPLIFNYNFGAGSLEALNKRWGFFAGGGVGYHLTTMKYNSRFYNEANKAITDHTFGPTINAGCRVGTGPYRRHNFEIRALYMKGLARYKPDVFGATFVFNI